MKRGMSSVVVSVLVIFVAFAAVILFWGGLQSSLESSGERTQGGVEGFDLRALLGINNLPGDEVASDDGVETRGSAESQEDGGVDKGESEDKEGSGGNIVTAVPGQTPIDLGDLTVPASRIPDWTHAGVDGGIPDVSEWPVIEAIDYGANPACNDGNDLGALQSAINTAAAAYGDGREGTVVHLSAGCYEWGTGRLEVKSNVVLRGDGPGVSIIEASAGGNSVQWQYPYDDSAAFVSINGIFGSAEYGISSGATKGSIQIVMLSSPPFTVGEYLRIREDVNPAKIDNMQYSNFVSQIIRVQAINGNTVTIDRPLRDTFSLNPRIIRLTPVVNAGVEDLTIQGRPAVGDSTDLLHFFGAINSWAKNVNFYWGNQGHVTIGGSRDITIESCHLESLDWTEPAPNGQAKGTNSRSIGVIKGATDTLVWNNIFERVEATSKHEAAPIGNVFAYNYVYNWVVPHTRRAVWVHGWYPQQTLFEGNVIDNGWAIQDSRWGKNGPGNTWFRNRALGAIDAGFQSHNDGTGFASGVYHNYIANIGASVYSPPGCTNPNCNDWASGWNGVMNQNLWVEKNRYTYLFVRMNDHATTTFVDEASVCTYREGGIRNCAGWVGPTIKNSSGSTTSTGYNGLQSPAAWADFDIPPSFFLINGPPHFWCDDLPWPAVGADVDDVTNLDMLPAERRAKGLSCNAIGTTCASNAECDDGNVCNGEETCVNEACQAGTPLPNPDDGLYCNGVETCDPSNGATVSGTPVTCSDGYSCTVDSCNEATDSCNFVPDNQACISPEVCDPASSFADPVTGCYLPVSCQGENVCEDYLTQPSCTQDPCDLIGCSWIDGQCLSVDPTLVLHLEMDDDLSDGSKDSSLYGNNFGCLGSLCPTLSNTEVKVGSGAYDYNNNELSLADSALQGNFPGSSGSNAEDFTISSWVQVNTGNYRHPIILKQGDDQRGFILSIETNGKPTLQVYNDVGVDGEAVATIPTALTIGEWHHIAVTYDYNSQSGSASANFYVDGVSRGSGLVLPGPVNPNTVDLEVGQYDWPTGYKVNLDGRLDDLRVYNRVLGSSEIEALRQLGMPAVCGDGVINGNEVCDVGLDGSPGNDFGIPGGNDILTPFTSDCSTFGNYIGGELKCASDCSSYDVSSCISGECMVDSDCDDGVSCSVDSCVNNICVFDSSSCGGTGSSYFDDFEDGNSAGWQTHSISGGSPSWNVVDDSSNGGGMVYSLTGIVANSPGQEYLGAYSYTGDLSYSDTFALDARIRSTSSSSWRDLAIIFNYQDPTHYYAVIFNAQDDPGTNGIFIVNGGPKQKLHSDVGFGTLIDQNYHDVRITKSGGNIDVYFDDMDNSVFKANDNKLSGGGIGFGTINDNGVIDEIELWGACTKEAKVCPDGSVVGRQIELACEFEACPVEESDGVDPSLEGESIFVRVIRRFTEAIFGGRP